MPMVILDLCGGTGSWSKPFLEDGFEVINVTLPQMDIMRTTFHGHHLIQFRNSKDEVVNVVSVNDIYGVLAAPPCTMFSDARTHAKTPRDLRGGMAIVNKCLEIIQFIQYHTTNDQSKVSPLKFWALENPWYGRLRWFLGNPVFVFDPWEFGDAYKKRTALWGYFTPPKKTHVTISDVMTKEQIEAHKTNSQKLPKFDRLLMLELKELKGVNNSDYWKQTKLRQTLRAITPQGFAKAFYKANTYKWKGGSDSSQH